MFKYRYGNNSNVNSNELKKEILSFWNLNVPFVNVTCYSTYGGYTKSWSINNKDFAEWIIINKLKKSYNKSEFQKLEIEDIFIVHKKFKNKKIMKKYFYSELESKILWNKFYSYKCSRGYYYLLNKFKDSNTISAPKNLTKEELKMYRDALKIHRSIPKAAACLLRSVMESILRRNFYPKDQKITLGSMLRGESVKNFFGKKNIEVLDAMRIIGNDGAHSDKATYNEKDKKDVFLLLKGIKLLSDEMMKSELKNNIIDIKKTICTHYPI
ncbi:MAG: DUF4145 domain-containing protein [Mycoplasmataceae bacterium]|nr:DUF4145 domain-containing protein [Mycoplasmataceae bacterium]